MKLKKLVVIALAYIFHTSLFYKDIIYSDAKSVSGLDIGYVVALLLVPIYTYVITIIIESLRSKIFNEIEDKVIDNILRNKWLTQIESTLQEHKY